MIFYSTTFCAGKVRHSKLHSVKSELAALDRQIQLSLTKVSQIEESEQQIIDENNEQKTDIKFNSDIEPESVKPDHYTHFLQHQNTGIKY